MQASATGLGGEDQNSTTSLLEQPSTAPTLIPKVAEQFIYQRPLPKFIPKVIVGVKLRLQ
jgi:hypothetical protein